MKALNCARCLKFVCATNPKTFNAIPSDSFKEGHRSYPIWDSLNLSKACFHIVPWNVRVPNGIALNVLDGVCSLGTTNIRLYWKLLKIVLPGQNSSVRACPSVSERVRATKENNFPPEMLMIFFCPFVTFCVAKQMLQNGCFGFPLIYRKFDGNYAVFCDFA